MGMKSLKPYPNFTIDDAEEIITAIFVTSVALGIAGLLAVIFGHPSHPTLMWAGILLLTPISLFVGWVLAMIFYYTIVERLYGGAIDNWKEIREERQRHLQRNTPQSIIHMIEKERRP